VESRKNRRKKIKMRSKVLLRRICRKNEGGAGGTSAESFKVDSYSFEEESKLSNADCSSPSGIPSVGVLIAYH
jgi:hypothetical protein